MTINISPNNKNINQTKKRQDQTTSSDQIIQKKYKNR